MLVLGLDVWYKKREVGNYWWAKSYTFDLRLSTKELVTFLALGEVFSPFFSSSELGSWYKKREVHKC